jgi:hypothetical protein
MWDLEIRRNQPQTGKSPQVEKEAISAMPETATPSDLVLWV